MRNLVIRVLVLFSMVLVSGADAHGSSAADRIAPARPGNTPDIAPYKELFIVNPHILGGARGNPGGPWHVVSFFRNMLPADANDADMVRFIKGWLGQWRLSEVNGFAVTPGDPFGQLSSNGICDWVNGQRRRDCQVGEDLDLTRAPFRLMAVVNRLDVVDTLGNPQPEARLVFGVLGRATNNPMDPSYDAPSSMILEYRLPTEKKTLGDWAREWHALSEASLDCDSDESCEPFRQRLETLISEFAGRGVAPGKPNGNALAHLRTNEATLTVPWQFRQFVLDGEGKQAALVQIGASECPDSSLNNSQELIHWAGTNAASIVVGKIHLPDRYASGVCLGSFGNQPHLRLKLDGVAESVRHTLSVNSCNGCHREEPSNPSEDVFFHFATGNNHLNPTGGVDGQERISRFVKEIELPKRVAFMQSLLGGRASD